MSKATEEQLTQYVEAAKYHSMGGRPEISGPLRAAARAGKQYEGDPSHLRTDGTSPLTDLPDIPPAPPIHGTGSSKKSWQEWATLATDFDAVVIEDASKDELIAMLRANGVIPTEAQYEASKGKTDE